MSVKRMLDCTASELAAYSKKELLESIAGCEGRVLACETIGITPPLLSDVTNAEYAASLSADILLLNMFDVQHPVVQALPKVPEGETVRELKRLTGRAVGACPAGTCQRKRRHIVADEPGPSGHRRKCLPRC